MACVILFWSMCMSRKRVLMYGLFGLVVFLMTCAFFVYAWTYTEKREVLLTKTLKIDGQEQKFTAFYLSGPAEAFYVTFNVSSGSIKFSPWDAPLFEDSLGYMSITTELLLKCVKFGSSKGTTAPPDVA